MANVLDYIPSTYHADIRNGTINVDLSTYVADAFAANRAVLFPEGTYTLKSYTLPEGSTLLTEGAATVFKQLGSAEWADSIFFVESSNVTIQDCTIEGIISLFDYTIDKITPGHGTGANNSEFNHGICIRAHVTEAQIKNVRIGNVLFKDIRGDGISIYCKNDATLEEIHIGDVYSDNVLRNGVAIVGGSNITIGNIDGHAIGYASFDCEPEDYSAQVDSIWVRSIRGAVCALQATPGSAVRNVRIAVLDTNPAHTSNSTPPYKNGSGVSYHRDESGLVLRNADNIFIGTHKSRDHSHHALEYIGDPESTVTDPSVEIDLIDYANIGSGDSTYYALINAGGMRKVTVRGGRFDVVADAQSLIFGNSLSYATACLVENVVGSGLVAKYVGAGRFTGLQIDTDSENRGIFLAVQQAYVASSQLRGGYLGYNVVAGVYEHVDFDQVSGGPYIFGGTSAGNRFRKSDVAGTFIEDGVYGSEGIANTGWTASSGTADKGAYAVYPGQDVSSAYVEAEAQATDDAVKSLSQRLKALEDAAWTLGALRS